jgi:hypothetical protein
VGCIGSSTCQHLGGSAGLASIPIRSITKSSREPIRGSFRNSRWSLRKRVDTCRWFVEGYVSVDTIDNHRHAYVTQSSTSVDNHRQVSTTIDNPRQLSTLRTRRPHQPSTSVDTCRHPYVTTVDTLRNWQSRLSFSYDHARFSVFFSFFQAQST